MIKFLITKIIILLITNTLCNTSIYTCDKNTVPCGCGRAPVDINARIINGENVIPSSWPMIISLRRDGSTEHVCGGTILSESYILTAAHCVETHISNVLRSNLTIAAGIYNLSQSEQIIRHVDKIIIHPLRYRFDPLRPYDIAILHLSEPLDLQMNSSLTRTCLPSRMNTSEQIVQYPLNGTSLIVIGWGRISSITDPDPEILQQVTVTLIHHLHKTCASTIYEPSTQFCAGLYEGGKGACYGDSGGPILQWIGDRWEQVGIVSYGEMGCATKGYPAVFTRVSYFYDWIQSHISNNNHTISSDNKTVHDRVHYYCHKYMTRCDCSRRDVLLSPSTIVKGEDAMPYSWSMIVSIRTSISDQHLCSGTILASSFILTAAHCLTGRLSQDLTIKAGIHYRYETDAIIRQVNHIYIHPNYTVNSNLYVNDMAILHLTQPLDTKNDTYIKQTCRSIPNDERKDSIRSISNGTRLVISGWDILGTSNFSRSDSLQQAEIYAINGESSNCIVTDDQRQFCAGRYGSDKGICYGGDSGSPVFEWNHNHWMQVGIASYCKMSEGPGVFTKVALYADWIQSILTPGSTKPVKVYSCDKKASCGCGQIDVALTSSRIIGGEHAVAHSWPMMVSVQRNNRHVCGGTILSDSFILTAARCLDFFYDNYYNFTIIAGIHKLSDTGIVKRKIDRVHQYLNYLTAWDLSDDVAIAHLDHPLPFGDQSSIFTKTCVPMKGDVPDNQYPELNAQLVAIGWSGKSAENPLNTLRQISIRLIHSNSTWCSSSNDTFKFCAESPNIEENTDELYLCKGDSGGPVFIYKNNHWEQIGIIPYQHSCNSINLPTIYHRLSPYLEWMTNITNFSLTTYSTSNNSNGTNGNSGDSTISQQRNNLIFTTLFLLFIIFS